MRERQVILVVALPNATVGQKATVGQGLPNIQIILIILRALGSPCPTAAFCPTVAFGKATTKITFLSYLSLSSHWQVNSLIREPL